MQSSYQIFKTSRRTKENDLLLTRNGTPYVHIPPSGAIYSNVVQRVELLPEYEKRFVWYALSNSCLNLRGYGDIIESFNMSTWNDLVITVPPKREQRKIVSYLDGQIATIDDAIAKKQRLIELLQEQKAILINNAITKGLDPDVPMRESGVEWIGRVPEHWEVISLKFFSSVQSGLTLGKTYSGKNLNTYPYLRVANVQYGYFNLDDIAEIRLPSRLAAQYFVRSGDILVTEGGDIDKLGRGTVWAGQINNCLHQNHIFAVRIDKMVTLEYFVSMVMGSDYGRKYFTKTANKTTNLASTNKTKLGNFPIALPPLDEQKAIIDRGNGVSLEIDGVISMVSSEIRHLREFGKVLIAEAVTGKIKI